MKYMFLRVKVPVPQTYNQRDVAEYVREAVQAWGGQRHPEDELFDLCRDATVAIMKDPYNDKN